MWFRKPGVYPPADKKDKKKKPLPVEVGRGSSF